jgi:hypothetical protein
MADFKKALASFIGQVIHFQKAYWLIEPKTGDVASVIDTSGEKTIHLFWSEKALAESVLAEHFPAFDLVEISLFELLVAACSASPDVIHLGLNWLTDISGHCVEGSYLRSCFEDRMSDDMLTRFGSYRSYELTNAVTECLNNNEIWVLYDSKKGLIAGQFVDRQWSSLFLCFSCEDRAKSFRDRYAPTFVVQNINLYYFLSNAADSMYGNYWGVNWGVIAGVTVNASWFRQYFRSVMLPGHLQDLQEYEKKKIGSMIEREKVFIDEVISRERVWYLRSDEHGYALVHSPVNHQLLFALFWSSQEKAESEQKKSFEYFTCVSCSLFEFLYKEVHTIEDVSLDYRLGLNFSHADWCLEVFPATIKTYIESMMPKDMYQSYQRKLEQGAP